MARTGRCLCGAVSFEARGEPSPVHACHCDDCRRFVGGAFIAVSVTDVDIRGPVRWFASSDWAERGSCETCGSALFWRLREGSEEAGGPAIALGAFDDPRGFGAITEHYFADAMSPSVAYADDGVRLSRAETLAKFGG